MRRAAISALSTGLTVLLMACGSSTTASSSSSTKFTTVEPGVLTVAMFGTQAPLIILEPGGQTISGVDGEIINQFAKDNGLKVKPLVTDFAGELLNVQQHKADIAVGVLYSNLRAKVMYYTYPWEQTTAVVITLKSFDYTGPDSFKGKIVATGTGFLWAPNLESWNSSSVQLFPNDAVMDQALLNGQIQGIVNDESTLTKPPLNASSAWTTHPINPGDFNIPASEITSYIYNTVQCSNHPIANAFNASLSKMKSDGKLQGLYQQYNLPVDHMPAILSSPTQICS